MAACKLTYFNIQAVQGEVARLIMAVGGMDFDDDRVETSDWKHSREEIKPPMDKLPVLEIDGTRLCQSVAICRLLARRVNLHGTTDLEEAKIDMMVDCMGDVYRPVTSAAFGGGGEKTTEVNSTILPERMEKLERLIGSNQFCVGNRLTWADIYFYVSWDFIEIFGGVINWEKYPKLLKHRKNIQQLEAIEHWVETKRPFYTPIKDHVKIAYSVNLK